MRTHVQEATLAVAEAYQRIVNGELFFAGRWCAIAYEAEVKVEDQRNRSELAEVRNAVEMLGMRCQRSAASRRCADCDGMLKFGDAHMCPTCRLVIVERLLVSDIWRQARPAAALELERLRSKLERLEAKRLGKRT